MLIYSISIMTQHQKNVENTNKSGTTRKPSLIEEGYRTKIPNLIEGYRTKIPSLIEGCRFIEEGLAFFQTLVCTELDSANIMVKLTIGH